jgi:plastocyanin
MRFYALALVSAAALSACMGGEKAADSTAAVDSPAVTTPAPAAAGGAATAAPVTGTTHEVKMVGDDKGYRFEPANVTVKAGDAVKFTMISGGPHNVAFDPANIPDDQEAQLDANMGTDKTGTLSSAMKMNPNETITISFGNIKPGAYPFNCTPHLAMGMKGVITVQ